MSAVLGAHGGLERFYKVAKFNLTVSVGGLLWIRMGYPAHRIVEITVETKHPKATFHNLDGDESNAEVSWIWTPQAVWKESVDGTVIEKRDMPRKSFENLTADSQWDHMHLLYFSGYAVWNYMMAPFYFTWPGFLSRELEGHVEANQTWGVLEVTYPDDFPAHCKTQNYYFDEAHRLRRIDYAAEVTKGGPAAHCCYDQRDVDGLLYPMLRRAIWNPSGIEEGGQTLVLLNFLELTVQDVEDGHAKSTV